MQFLFRFDRPREHQARMLEDIYSAVSNGKSILVNAPTGIGKTDAALAACMTFASESGLDVFFLTPKISQHAIAVDALWGMREKFGRKFNFIDLVGKANLCTNDAANMLPSESFYPSCEKLIKGKKCTFYNRFKEAEELPERLVSSASMGHNAFFDEAFSAGLCGYYAAVRVARNAKVIIADYAHMLNPYTRHVFLKSISHSLQNSIVIWDEAHNIVSLAAEYLSSSITQSVVERAQKELDSIGNSMDISYLGFVIKSLAQKKLRAVPEAFVDKVDFPEEISEETDKLSDALEKHGLEYLEKSGAKRSSLIHVSRFLRAWGADDGTATRILSRRGPNIRVAVKSLYPRKSLEVLKEPYANVFMSATMIPMGMYSDMFMLDKVLTKSYESPFPRANRVAFIDGSITTKYENRSADEYRKIADKIKDFKKHIPGNIAVFFPSFRVLENVSKYISDMDVITQNEGMNSTATRALLRRFSGAKGSALFAVMGGSLSEGVDYSNNIIKGIVIVGIPLSVPDLETKARISVFEKQFGDKGFEYAYTIPAVIRAVQAAGRAVRSEVDRAVILFLDRRYTWSSYSSLINSSVGISFSGDYIKAIDRFWKPGRSASMDGVDKQEGEYAD